MASKLSQPHHLLVHGWIKVDNEKMSKSRHNVIDPKELAQQYGVDEVRYYLMKQFSIGQDSNFSFEDLEQRITSDLANDLGNLLNRMSTLAEKNQLFTVKCTQWSESSKELHDHSLRMLTSVKSYMQHYAIHMALAEVWKFIGQANAFFHAHEPWKLAQKDSEKFKEVIAAVCYALSCIGTLLWPIMPSSMEKMLLSLGIPLELGVHNLIEKFEQGACSMEFTIQKIPNLFNKIEPKKIEPTVEVKKEEAVPLDISEFVKVELRIGTIEECHTIEKSDKLYRLQVNFGEFGMRQVLSGIRQSFQPEQLVGKQAVFVFNLKPRSMMGLESQGMILTAKDDQDRLQLVGVPHAVPNGTRLQ